MRAEKTMTAPCLETNADLYFSLIPGIDLHRSATGGAIIYSVDLDKPGHGFQNHQLIETEGYFIDFLKKCDGRTSYTDIRDKFSRDLGPLFGPSLAQNAAAGAISDQLVLASETPIAKREIICTGSDRSFQPLHLSLEIIETCNFACEHCYYSSSPFKKGRLELDEAIAIIDKARRAGVRVVEITGGECTIHPQFRDILSHAHKTFDLVAVITNGYKLGNDKDLAEFVGGFDRLIVQISMDGLPKHHDVFRKHKNSWESCERAVKRMVASGRNVRIAMSVTPENIDDIPQMVKYAEQWGVLNIAFTPIASIGRGCNVSDPGAGTRELVAAISQKLQPFHGSRVLSQAAAKPEAAEHKQAVNCGAGWRTFAVDYDGDVRACNYSRDSKKFGNVLTDEYEAVFSQQSNFMFHNAPSPGGELCVGCDYYMNCKGCFVKAFTISEKEYPECPWRKHWFPDMALSLDEHRPPVASAADAINKLPTGDKRQACSRCEGLH